jgi:hypothetical protein
MVIQYQEHMDVFCFPTFYRNLVPPAEKSSLPSFLAQNQYFLFRAGTRVVSRVSLARNMVSLSILTLLSFLFAAVKSILA